MGFKKRYIACSSNRIRCFPHIINLACQALINEIKRNSEAVLAYEPLPLPASFSDANQHPFIPPTPLQLHAYTESLQRDLIGHCRSLVGACRVSGKRRKELRDIIIEGNEKGYWNPKLSVLELLRDCETRWSSTYLMIDRIIYLYPAIETFLLRSQARDLTCHLFTDKDLRVLRDIRQALQVPHMVQELLSAEQTPTLSLALPAYESLIETWRVYQARTLPELSHYIGMGIAKLEEYVMLARRTRMYAHAMVLNPTIKFAWMNTNWSAAEVRKARGWILDSMTTYQTKLREEREKHAAAVDNRSYGLATSISAVEKASQAQAVGYSRLRGLNIYHRHSSAPTSQAENSSPASSTPTASTSTLSRSPSVQEIEHERTRKLEEDRKVAERELDSYESAGLYSMKESTGNLVNFWEFHSSPFPLLFHVAMDVLPAQASAVSCERAFSSSKETSTLRRSKISPTLFEALQILKYSYRQDRLVFTGDIQLAKAEDYTISGPVTMHAATELRELGQFNVLEELIANAEADGYPPPVLDDVF